MLIGYKRGQTGIVLRVKLLDSSVSTGAGKTGLTNSSSGLIISTIADNESTATIYAQASSNVETITTLGTFAAPTSGKCRFKEVDATNHKGVYEIQIADARYAVSSAKSLLVSISGVTGLAETDVVIPLRDLDPYDAVRAGLTALPNANAEASGGLYTRGTGAGQIKQTNNGEIDVNTTRVGGTTQTAGDIPARLPSALTDNGNMKSSLLEIISTALSEGATGRIAAAWQAAWNVISPVWTAQSVNQSGDVYPLVDTEIAAVLAAVDTEVAAIKAKTDNLPSDPADASDITAAHAATDAEIAKIPKSDGVVGWNATARAQIQAEAEDALAAFWVIATGTIDNTGATQVTFRTDLTAPNSTYNDLQLEITSGTLAGQTKVILTYLQANGQITLSEALTEAPANGVTFRIKKIHTHPVASIQQGLATAGEQAAQTTLLNTIVGYLDTEVAAILAAVDTEVAAIKAKTDNLPSDPADQSAVEAAILAFGTTPMSYSARATGAMPTRDQLMLELLAGLLMHETSGLVKTLKKPDGTSSTKTYQFDADPPTSIQELT